jgi:hypothetical protein
MVDAFLCLVLDVFGLANRKCRPLGMGFPFPWVSFQGRITTPCDLDSRFLVALPPASDLLLFAKLLFFAAKGGGNRHFPGAQG